MPDTIPCPSGVSDDEQTLALVPPMTYPAFCGDPEALAEWYRDVARALGHMV